MESEASIEIIEKHQRNEKWQKYRYFSFWLSLLVHGQQLSQLFKVIEYITIFYVIESVHQYFWSKFNWLFIAKECGENQYFNFCAAECTSQCKNFGGKKCPLISNMMCHFKCDCSPGYLRIEEDKCIEANSKKCGGPNESH